MLRQQFPAVQQVKLPGEAALELLHLFHRAPPALRPLLCRVGVQQAQHQHHQQQRFSSDHTLCYE